MTRFNIPTILIVFGATGDLMKRKIIPSLFHLYQKNELPEKFQVIGYSRRHLSDDNFQQGIVEILKYHKGEDFDQSNLAGFLALFSYQPGRFDAQEDYTGLAERLGNIDGQWQICTNKLFYLSVPPEFYQTIFHNLKTSGLTDPCSEEEGWTRILVEKPFGDDLDTARRLDQTLSQLFKEEQIYRIDHYLAKETLQNILAFRFANNLFEGVWHRQHIEKIEIRLHEKIGVEDRGSFYDRVGALRDVGQNHLLQMLALVTMEPPTAYTAEAIRQQRAKALRTIKPLVEAEIGQRSYRAQYAGYQQIEGVAPNSQTETYFKLCLDLATPAWQGVPIILESGKRMGEPLKEIVVTFKHPSPCLCPPGTPHLKNQVIFRIEPKEGIQVTFLAKEPGLRFTMKPRSLDFLIHGDTAHTQYVEEYGKLLLDCIAGDQTLFVSSEEVEAMWAAIDPIIKAWEKTDAVPLQSYQPDTKTIAEAPLACEQGTVSAMRPVGIVGLGKMGGNLAQLLLEKGWPVAGYNRTADDTKALEAKGLIGTYDLAELATKSGQPGERLIWLMLPAGEVIDTIIAELTPHLVPGDTIIDAGNSFYKDSIRRAEQLASQQVQFVDVGFSGGPGGARTGGCLMVGNAAVARDFESLFAAAARPGAYQLFDGVGAGHFVKMIHNGIEYGMMQAIAEGFAVLKTADYQLDLSAIAEIYNNGSVIESRLVAWLKQAFAQHGPELADVSGTVKHTGEGEWTVKTAAELGIPVPVIADALEFRKLSEREPSYTGKILSALREQFGGHSIK